MQDWPLSKKAMQRFMQAVIAITGVFILAGAAEARIVSIDVDRVEPFAEEAEFGDTGSYVKISGTAKGELDPKDPLNKVIVNLDKAPLNERGMVEYETDFYIMRPADLGKGNGSMLYEVTNRGRKFLMHWVNDAPATSPAAVNEPKTLQDAGNGYVLREGYTIVWSGWDPDAPVADNGMTIRVPVATDNGKPIIKTIRDEFVFGARLNAASNTAPLSYEAANLDQSQARLTVRVKESDTPRDIPADGWAYNDSRSIKLLPEGTAFQPGLIYDFHYPAKDPKILGIGYAATRDLVSFLRYETKDDAGNANPIAGSGKTTGIKSALGLGISQSGRYLHDHIHQGFNQDESHRKVFDGVQIHIAGSGGVFMNEEFGQPNRTSARHEDHHFPESRFPFSYTRLTDPLTGNTDALLRGDGFDPLVIETNTSTEYWVKGASLLHTDPLGTRDVEIPDSVRLYHIAGTQHGGRVGLSTNPGLGMNMMNPHNPSSALRALLSALDKWASEGVEPPASRIPTMNGGTLVPPTRLGFPAIPGVKAPDFANHILPFGNWIYPKHEFDTGYGVLVPKVDADGNEIAGIRLPDITAPLATYTGWNFYNLPGLENELYDRNGSYFPFAVTKAEREAAGDPRLSLKERYGNH